MNGPADFTKFVPGFEFFQGLMKNAGSAIPNMGQWIAPTLDPEELGKRIEQLKTVQFWLEQNAKLLGTTIQALEVQRMTLSTLKNMNMPVERMADAFKMDMPEAAPTPSPAPSAFSSATPPAAAKPTRKPRASGTRKAAEKPAPTAGSVDPLQWWGALTQQFTELAGQALKDPVAASKTMADQTFKAATKVPRKVSAKVSAKVSETARSAVRRRTPR